MVYDESFLQSEPQKLPTNKIQDLANFNAEDVSTAEKLDEFLSFRAMCSDLEIKLNITEAVLPVIICNNMERASPNISN